MLRSVRFGIINDWFFSTDQLIYKFFLATKTDLTPSIKKTISHNKIGHVWEYGENVISFQEATLS